MTALTLGAVLAPAEAQDAEPDSALAEAVEIVVTATGHEADSLFVPASTAVVGRDKIQGVRARRTLTDALSELPSVMVQKTSYGQASPFIRGFTGHQTVLLIDGIRLNNSTFRSGPNQYWATVDPFSVERLELARGASSVLYGSDAVGGAVNAIARRRTSFEPGFHSDRRVVVRWSDAESSWTTRTEVHGNQDNLGFVIGGTYRSYGDLNAGGPTRRQPGTAYNDTDGDLRLDWRADDDTTWTLGIQHVDQDDVPRTERTVNGIPFHGTSVGSELRRDLSQTRDLVYLRVEQENPGVADTVQVTASWHRQREVRVRDRDVSRTDVQGTDVGTLGLQAQLESDTDIGYVTYGVEYWRDDVDSFRRDYTGGALSLERVQGPVADNAAYHLLGVYAQNEFDIETTAVTAGARFTYARASAGRVDNPAVGGADPATPGNVIGVRDSWTNVVGSARAVHPLDNHWNVFGGVSQAFRAPNLSDLTRLDATSGVETPSPGLDPERFLSFEAGVKGRHEGWSTQATLWRTRIRDLIVPSPTGVVIGGTPEVRKDNADGGWINGVEFEASVDAGGGWTVTGAASWMDGEVDQLDPAGNTVQRPLSRLMPLTGTVTADFRPRGAGWHLWASGQAATSQDQLSLRDKTDTRRIPPDGTPRFAVLHVGGRVELSDSATLSLIVENVANANYRIHGSGVNEPGRNLVLAVDLEF